MPKCECACHNKKGLFTKLSETFFGVTVVGINLTVILFLMGGAFSSIMILARMYPGDLEAILSFIILSEFTAKIAVVSFIIYLVFKLFQFIAGENNGS